MRARPTRTVTVTTTATNIRKSPVAGDANSLPVTFATLRYPSGGGTIQLLASSPYPAPFASGTLTFATNPIADETIAVNGVTFTFKAVSGGATEVTIGATKDITATNLANILNASANGSITVATYSAVYGGFVVNIIYDTAGTGGNAFTLANSSGTVAVTRSAATLLGGTASGDGQAVVADTDFNDVDQSLARYAVASAGSISLAVTDYEA